MHQCGYSIEIMFVFNMIIWYNGMS